MRPERPNPNQDDANHPGKRRTEAFQQALAQQNVDWAILTDPDTIAYFSGFRSAAGIDIGRPSILVVPATGEAALVTPLMDAALCRATTWLSDIRSWRDGPGTPWGEKIRAVIGEGGKIRIGIEAAKTSPLIAGFIGQNLPRASLTDVSQAIAEQRIIKDVAELNDLRHAGTIGDAMITAARHAITPGVSEVEIALAMMDGGLRAGLRADPDEMAKPGSSRLLPTRLPLVQSGDATLQPFRSATSRRIAEGDPVHLNGLGAAAFGPYSLTIARTVTCGQPSDQLLQAHEIATSAQTASLRIIRAGAFADEVHAEAVAVYQDAGIDEAERSGHGTGHARYEAPELKEGIRTPLRAGMVLVVAAQAVIENTFGVYLADTVLVTENGYAALTNANRDLVD